MTNKEVLDLTANAIGVAVQAKVDEYRDAANNAEDWHKKNILSRPGNWLCRNR